MIQFFLRRDKLVMHVTMRSNDAWWGTPHDWGQFSQLQLAVASILGVEAAEYYHHAISFHLYERDFKKIDGLTPPHGDPLKFESIWTGGSLHTARVRAQYLIESWSEIKPVNPTEEWHIRQQKLIGGNDV
jgi:thymidylate synthase